MSSSQSENEEVRQSLVRFMEKLSGGKFPTHQLGWNATSDPCQDHWHGVHCYTSSVGSITLNGFRFTGTLDAQSLCSAKSLAFLKLPNNTISGQIPEEIGLCTSLLILDLSGNRFSGSIPENLGECTNLTILDLSNNRLSGSIPDSIPRLTNRPAEEPRLTSFHVERNFLNGPITGFDFGVIGSFNVSNNNFSGPLPDGVESFGAGCFMGNPGLCGYPLPNSCPDPKPVWIPGGSGPVGLKEIGMGWVFIVFAGWAFLLLDVWTSLMIC
ncbi:Probable inactive receptor kinase At2g26730 [Linum grandiflorum]